MKNVCVAPTKYSVQLAHSGGSVGWHMFLPAARAVQRWWKSSRSESWCRRVAAHSGHGSSINALGQLPRLPQSGHFFRMLVGTRRAYMAQVFASRAAEVAAARSASIASRFAARSVCMYRSVVSIDL